MTEDQLTLFDDQTIEDPLGEEKVIPFSYSITSYGADYPVDAWVKRLEKGDIFIPSFQREYVWSINDASRFVESLLLGLPVPGIFLSKEYQSEKMLVIDGQQRLRSLQFFYNGVFKPTGKRFELRGVQEKFEGKSYSTLRPQDRRRLDDSILHATIVKQDEPSDDNSSIYHIFERINSGGRALSSQEIRASIYHGPFRELLADLNRNREWRAIFGKVNKRMRDQELILRFLALYFYSEHYSSPMKGFLNRYMAQNRDLQAQSADRLREVFSRSIGTIYEGLGEDAFRPKQYLNAAVFDSVMVGIARRLEEGSLRDYAKLEQQYRLLLDDSEYQAAYQKSTAQERSVETRLRLATEAFDKVD